MRNCYSPRIPKWILFLNISNSCQHGVLCFEDKLKNALLLLTSYQPSCLADRSVLSKNLIAQQTVLQIQEHSFKNLKEEFAFCDKNSNRSRQPDKLKMIDLAGIPISSIEPVRVFYKVCEGG